MDRIITATEANQHFSEVLREVAAGESVTVTSRGKPIARIVPAEIKRNRDLKAMLDRMEKLPGLVTGPWRREDLYKR